ncbi:alpha/beta family hydrolase [Pseudomarimonas arenosa]|uniref:KANL3/Tex30 alpha/beta hydrolase-like domain-containing protein n=1 Tax=Pseudomarimonas arenosa TaxID=2774145 RepID=A0AAW3ZSQ9_9GAMM|nr:alpha/beta family hydrolase [Pseudomarimonas arenosa]MBD8527497.1 hypothetical protein [Pseudomarimonas arenosa]
MPGHVILSHGLHSSPAATKVSAMAAVAERLGWTHERPDYSQIDADGRVEDIHRRLSLLVERARQASQPLVLAGSSMGAFISALASQEVPCVGLYLIAPPIVIDGFAGPLRAAAVPTAVLHGWNDEICPVGDVVRWAQARRAHLELVDDGHRLENHVQHCAEAFGRFLARR